jgi:Bacterial low temperature requirement A protein (LtrA)
MVGQNLDKLTQCQQRMRIVGGFGFPGLGRSRTKDWTIEGGQLSERCQLFVIVALGESLLAIGGTLAEVSQWNALTMSALGATFLSRLAMWWLYFATSSKTLSLLANPPANGELLVEGVKFLRNAETSGTFEQTFAMLNPK